MNQADAGICQTIEDLLDGRISAAEFHKLSKALPDGATALADEAWHDASHFAADEDIRLRDHEYARRTEEKLRWYLRTLRGQKQRAAQ